MSTSDAPAPRRGRLRIYLGAAPGAGKTYAMLGEAHRRIARGGDVVVAIVNTHGRPRTEEQLAGLEVVPPRRITYRGVEFEELDLDAVLARRPAVALVDELAHTNVPGSRHAKRWQDVAELLAAGIDVLSTVNIQHLESLADVVEQITGVAQRERIPDAVVRRAEQIELVDITPQALRRRLAHGNVYAPEKVDAALRNYFREGNLTALREIALLWLADQVDLALAKYRGEHAITDTWEARERVVVAVTGGPESETLVRRASRIAAKAGADLLVVHVVRGDGLTTPEMGAVRELAAGLGADVHSVVGDDVPATLLDFARQVNATQLVVGTSRRSRWARILDEGIGAAVVRDSGKIDVHMVTHEHRVRGPRPALLGRHDRRLAAWLAAFLIPVAATAVMAAIVRLTGTAGLNALFFVAVLAVALFGGVGPAIVAALLSGLLLNYFFTEPLYSLTIAEPANFVTTVVLLVVAVAVAALVDTAAARAREAGSAAREAELLALFAGAVLRGADVPALLEKVRETYAQRGVSLVRLDGDRVEVLGTAGAEPPSTPAAADTRGDVEDSPYALLLAGPRLRPRDRRVLTAVAGQAAGLVRQRELAAEAARAAMLAETDRLRRLLLSAVSHDLRTPLAAVKAAAAGLRSTDVEFSPEDTAELLATIEESTDQLTRLVTNLLDSSRLAAGVVTLEPRPVDVDEVVHSALLSLGVDAGERLTLELGDTLVRADATLLERVLANLLDNALRYAPDGPIRVCATNSGERTTVTVADHGPGLDSGVTAFPRTGDQRTGGAGLGLVVARGFVEAMGGTLTAAETPGGGTTMIIDLPAVSTEAPA
ncbi:sensor histidine kinase [Nocardia farcinica]|uniref:sensor histidine kinase n=1 Tax=Nocardia farcinica TaxID=37329 RepID=UPI0015F07D47|nr:sensor histidine kinase KdpD [Nocardia farcinica]MBA4855169.1 sensor histidine kinase KdpD [Nocardia farcinica]MBC9817837.1 sensor histidine kinase KdpD [Nocardia farcinica]